MLRFLLSMALGATLAYFLDPDRGRRRRAIASDRIAKALRQGSHRLERKARYAASYAEGISQRAAHLNKPDEPAPNDPTLVQRVESELFRDPNIPKGHININAENGVIVLRGQLDDADQIRKLEESVRNIPGVDSVENLLHLPDT